MCYFFFATFFAATFFAGAFLTTFLAGAFLTGAFFATFFFAGIVLTSFFLPLPAELVGMPQTLSRPASARAPTQSRPRHPKPATMANLG